MPAAYIDGTKRCAAAKLTIWMTRLTARTVGRFRLSANERSSDDTRTTLALVPGGDVIDRPRGRPGLVVKEERWQNRN